MSVTRLTLLAPARDLAVGKAAVQAGADAVYIGAPRFGARQAAGNSIEDIAALAEYAHLFHVQVLVTLNTLLYADEYAEACALAHELYAAGADALIIQDLHLLETDLPPIRLHASTQCDNRTAEQVLRLQALGFRRVVLARELCLDEIRAIDKAVKCSHAAEPIELEAFVHGALCVSYSGRCYMSEVLTGRSANRGCCAQMCRMRYDLLDKDGHEILDDHGVPVHQRYLLSLQDMDRSACLQELIEAGVTAFKIEGRLKDADYVTNVVAYYRHLLDDIISRSDRFVRASSGKEQTDFIPNPAKSFHRGQTDYFMHGRTRPMANWDTPKSTGEAIGEVVFTRRNAIGIQLLPQVQLHNGDGLCFGDKGFAINHIEIPDPKCSVALVTPNRMPAIAAGTTLYRNLDTVFLKTLHAERHIPVAVCFEDIPEGYRLRIGGHSAVFAAPHEKAQNSARALQTIREQLGKLGDTPYVANKIEVLHKGVVCTAGYPYFIPIRTLNLWRREVSVL